MAPLTNILTIDLEEYFHPTEVQRVLPPDRWASLPSRVVSRSLRRSMRRRSRTNGFRLWMDYAGSPFSW